jgi:hypothetical protein
LLLYEVSVAGKLVELLKEMAPRLAHEAGEIAAGAPVQEARPPVLSC